MDNYEKLDSNGKVALQVRMMVLNDLFDVLKEARSFDDLSFRVKNHIKVLQHKLDTIPRETHDYADR